MDEYTRRVWRSTFAVTVIVFAIAVASTACDDDSETPPPFTTSTATSTTRPTTTVTAPPTSEAVVDTTAPSSPWMQGPYTVMRVVDGDTIDVSQVGRIRLIGIDTPEVYGGAECYGSEASARMIDLVGGRQVFLEYDPSQGLADRYDRTLAYVWSGDTDVGKSMIASGHAEEYLYDSPYRHYAEYVATEQLARQRHVGLWGAC